MNVSEKSVLITGAGSGIGAATAERFGDEGAAVVVTDKDESAAADTVETVREAGGDARAYELDVRDRDRFAEVYEQAEQAVGGIDVLVNNAGISPTSSFVDAEEDAVREAIDVNVFGTWNGCKVAVPRMRDGDRGSIVNVASIAGYRGWVAKSAYCLSKAAVLNFTRSLAMEEIDHGIRVNAVCPGTTDTPGTREFFETEVFEQFENLSDSDRARKLSENQYPIGRFLEPGEIANCIAFLASDEASGIVGEALTVDGGYTIA